MKKTYSDVYSHRPNLPVKMMTKLTALSHHTVEIKLIFTNEAHVDVHEMVQEVIKANCMLKSPSMIQSDPKAATTPNE